MGQRLVVLSSQDPQFHLRAALEASGSPHLGRDAGELAGVGRLGVPVMAELLSRVDVIIDFSVPAAAVAIAEYCAERRIPLVVATTGLEGEARARVLAAAQTTPLLISPSMSLAVNLTMKLVREAARILKNIPEGVDVEVIERHHRFKEDAPSGTALKFGEIIAEEMHQTQHVHGRHGRPGLRPRDEIGYHALRVGDNVGEHMIVFGLMGETIDIAVKSHTRDSYAYGALAAAKFLAAKKPGLYSMADVMGFETET
ncbi:MAG: 4-hydroxy-tetrahydrodipicolinate reductase [Planctomycetaceae bacterium]|nr:MAG: 4-hydroxy-tetrahydrodipicolinate reductase [Planctomycetaceae bacterium]